MALLPSDEVPFRLSVPDCEQDCSLGVIHSKWLSGNDHDPP
jgi:hypothetical protein